MRGTEFSGVLRNINHATYFRPHGIWLSHYVLRGGVLEKCCNLQNPMNTSRQLGQVEICSTLRDLICHILWPFYCHFMAFFGSKWPYWAIGSPSDPKWVEHWLNMVEHCISHLGG